MLTAIIGEGTDEEFLRFLINKFEGESIDTIVNNIFEGERMKSL